MKIRPLLIEIAKILFVGILIFLVSLVVFSVYLRGELPFIPHFDVRTQYWQLFSEFSRMIRAAINGKYFPFWSWNTFLGNNYWSSKTYQYLGDFFAYVQLLFKSHFFDAFLYTTILRYIYGGINFFLYSKGYNWKTETRVIGSLLFVFSSYVIRFTDYPYFMTIYFSLPLYLLGVHKIIDGKRPYLFILMVTFLALANYYLFISVLVFSIFYFLFIAFSRKFTLREGSLYFVRFVAYFILGTSIASFFLVPSVLYVLDNNRVLNTNFNLLLFPSLKTYLHILASFFININVISSRLFYPEYYNLESYLWTGGLTILLLPQFLFGRKTKTESNKRYLYLLLLLFLFIPLGSSIFHGFSEPNFRWQFSFVIFNLVIILGYVDKPESINTRLLIKSFIFDIIVVMLFAYQFYKQNSSLENLWIFWMYIGMLFIYFCLLILSKRKHHIHSVVLLIFVLFELVTFSRISFNRETADRFDWKFIEKVESVLGEEKDFKLYLESLDEYEELYRVYVPMDSLYWHFSLNMNLIYDIPDVKTYDSLYQPANADLNKIVPNPNFYDWYIDLKDSNVLDFVGVKYAIVSKPEDLPSQNYTKVGNYNWFDVYRNDRYKGAFCTYSKVIDYNDPLLKVDTDVINQYVISSTDNIERIRKYLSNDDTKCTRNVKKYPNMLLTELEVIESGFVVSAVPYDEGWSVNVNNKNTEKFSVNGGFLGFPIEAGLNEIKLNFMPKGFKIGVILSLFSGVLFILFVLYIEVNIIKRKRKIRD